MPSHRLARGGGGGGSGGSGSDGSGNEGGGCGGGGVGGSPPMPASADPTSTLPPPAHEPTGTPTTAGWPVTGGGTVAPGACTTDDRGGGAEPLRPSSDGVKDCCCERTLVERGATATDAPGVATGGGGWIGGGRGANGVADDAWIGGGRGTKGVAPQRVASAWDDGGSMLACQLLVESFCALHAWSLACGRWPLRCRGNQRACGWTARRFATPMARPPCCVGSI